MKKNKARKGKEERMMCWEDIILNEVIQVNLIEKQRPEGSPLWKTLAPWKKSYNQPRQHVKKHRHYQQRSICRSYGFSNSHVWIWELDYKESWVPKYWCFSTVVLEKTLESPLDCNRSNQSIFFFLKFYFLFFKF